jgi:hypothetical protein
MGQRTKRAAENEQNENRPAARGERAQNKSVPSKQGSENIEQELEKLESEWSYEKVAKVAAAAFVILGVFLSPKKRRKMEEFGDSMAEMLGVESLEQWTPPPVILEKIGLRRQEEIDEEIKELQEQVA